MLSTPLPYFGFHVRSLKKSPCADDHWRFSTAGLNNLYNSKCTTLVRYVYAKKREGTEAVKASVPSLRILLYYLLSDIPMTDKPAPPERSCNTAHYAIVHVIEYHRRSPLTPQISAYSVKRQNISSECYYYSALSSNQFKHSDCTYEKLSTLLHNYFEYFATADIL